MEAIIVKYVQLICVTIFMGGNANCATLMVRNEESNNLKISACVADCLKTELNYNLTECYKGCSKRIETLDEVIAVQKNLNATFHLYCRDSKRLLIEVDINNSHVENEKFIYMLIIQETRISFVDRLVYISNDPTIELRDLEPSESYNISLSIVSSNYDVQLLGTKVFTTLKSDYKPENVTDIWVEENDPIMGNGKMLNVVVGWNPARDQTCLYEVIIHGLDSDGEMDMIPMEKNDKNLYFHMFRNLRYNEEYRVAVRGVNTEFREFPKRLESDLVWKNFKTPSCRDYDLESKVCGPEPIENLHAVFEYLNDNAFSIKVTWNRTKYDPEHYSLQISDVIPSDHVKNYQPNHFFSIEGDKTSIFIPKLTITGPKVFFELTAHFNNQTSKDYRNKEVYHLKHRRSSVIFYAFIGVIVIGLIILLRIYMNQIFGNFTRKQIANMNPDLIQSITIRSMKEAIDDHTRDADMEIERDSIELSGRTLGEGAFGLVKHAILIRNGKKIEVAVKMLKNSPNIEDIKQFNQEISVMKSVGKHSNIVSIIGHCTENIHELMLLTEFCDAGNLLNFLINESKKQSQFYNKKMTLAPAISQQKYPDSLYNFDGGRKEILSKKVGCEPRTSVWNPMYDDLNNNANLAVEMTVTNPLYLELSDKDPKSVIIDIEKSEEDFLTSDNLIEFARQVSEGMSFLARKKVVHRDLAARNILCYTSSGSDKIIMKIADFGLSRDIYEDKIYRKKGQGKLPIKWLAIESMTHNEYTSQSDVWSFGILLYEIVTLGESPYPSMGVDTLVKFLESGYRMEKPTHCHPSLYEVMMECWRANPADRPTFNDLTSKLKHFQKLTVLENEQFIDLPNKFRRNTSSYYLNPIA